MMLRYALLFCLLLPAALPAQELTIPPASLRVFQPLPTVMESRKNPITEAKVQLGRMLYYDARLSKGQTVSCNTCHQLDKYGVDNKPTSPGHLGKRGERNSPTVYNAAGHMVQFWDGRSPDVEDQAKGPVTNPVEMAMRSPADVEAVLRSIPEYVTLFGRAFPGQKNPVTFDNFALAVGAFERKLVTPSRFDRFLAGDQKALTPAEKAGLKDYLDAGCATCHAGRYLGGEQYQKLGNVRPWPNPKDLGRYQVTKADRDKLLFKVPSLRNIAKTGPYFHDGKVTTLPQAVKLMGHHQLGITLTPAKITSIVAFLNSLTGDLPMEYIRQPQLPKSTASTPKPNLSE